MEVKMFFMSKNIKICFIFPLEYDNISVCVYFYDSGLEVHEARNNSLNLDKDINVTAQS